MELLFRRRWLLLGLPLLSLALVSILTFRYPPAEKSQIDLNAVGPSSDTKVEADQISQLQLQDEYASYLESHPPPYPASKECTEENNCPVASRPHLGTLEIVQPKGSQCIEHSLRLLDNDALTETEDLPSSAAFWQTDDLAALQEQYFNATIHSGGHRGPLTAVVLRAWDEFEWAEDDIENVRTMLYHLLRGSSGEYQLFILMQSHNETEDPFMDNINLDNVPSVLRGLVEPWNTHSCRLAYNKMMYSEVVGQQFMPLQLFADRHPEFEYFWNLDMDVRVSGDYYSCLARSAEWARQQPTRGLWDRNSRFYIPSFHGSYEDFANSLMPEYAAYGTVETDLISYFPLFNVTDTSWMWKDAQFGFDENAQRWGTVGTNVRCSRQLLDAMAAENQRGATMFAEMWPSSAAYLHELKAVYVPHAVFLEGDWSAKQLQDTFNAGPGGQVGGSSETILDRQEFFEQSTWSWNAQFGRKLYDGWKGQPVDRKSGDEFAADGELSCLPPVFLHPIRSKKSNGSEPQGWH